MDLKFRVKGIFDQKNVKKMNIYIIVEIILGGFLYKIYNKYDVLYIYLYIYYITSYFFGTCHIKWDITFKIMRMVVKNIYIQIFFHISKVKKKNTFDIFSHILI